MAINANTEDYEDDAVEVDTWLDLNHPENFINRTEAEQRRALIYFLNAGAVAAFYDRIACARQKNPSFVIDLREGDLEKACLWGIDLQGADMREMILERVNLTAANLSGAKLNLSNMRYADLRGANLSGADLTGVDMRGALMDDCDLTGAIMKDVKQGDGPHGLHPLLARQAEIKAKKEARLAAEAAAAEEAKGGKKKKG